MPLSEPHYVLNDLHDKNKCLESMFIEGKPLPPLLKTLQRQFARKRYVEIKPIKVYTVELAFILLTKKLSAVNERTMRETTIDGTAFFNQYGEGFIEGEKYFNENFTVSPETLYSKEGKAYIDTLWQNLFVSGDGENKPVPVGKEKYKRGWSFVKNDFPVTISEAIIRRFGYYSGIVSSVEALAKEHPKLFDVFMKPNGAAKGPKITAEVLASFCGLINQSGILIQQFNESAPKYCKRVCSQYGLDYIGNTRKKYPGRLTNDNKKKIQTLIIPRLPNDVKDVIQKHLNKENLLKQKLSG